MAALAVVLVSLLVAIGLVLSTRGSVDEALSQTQREIAESAHSEALAFLTVDHENMDRVIDAVLSGATGDFAAQYDAQRDKLTREAQRTQANSAPEIVALGVGDHDADSATVLVAANSTVTNTGTGTDGQVRYYRLRLELVREDGRWLTDDVRFVR